MNFTLSQHPPILAGATSPNITQLKATRSLVAIPRALFGRDIRFESKILPWYPVATMKSQRPWLDKVYLVYFIVHIPVLFRKHEYPKKTRNQEIPESKLTLTLVVDLVPFYPKFLWATPDAPLSFLGDIRVYYFNVSVHPFSPWRLASRMKSYMPPINYGLSALFSIRYFCIT